MKYPKSCLTEAETVERALAGESLSRFGDGEFNLALGRNCQSQWANPKLAAELRQILLQAPKGCLPCLPYPFPASPKRANWLKFEKYDLQLGKQQFGSAFITRPDSSPWIDTAEYWDRVTDFWRGKDVTLVLGSMRSLKPDALPEAANVRAIWGTYRDAYGVEKMLPNDARNHPNALRSIDEIMEAVGTPGHTVLLCLGATATVMAARLTERGVHAVDLGHIGLFMRSAGAYGFKPDDLLSPEYRDLMKRAHAEMEWGGSGHKQAEAVATYADELGALAILDYGCGQGFLSKALAARVPPKRVTNYDPGIPGKDGFPKPSHLVVCSDVLEHCEPEKIDAVLAHIHALAGMGAYLVIATRPANKTLPDGRNAHVLLRQPDWWLEKVGALDWTHERPPAVKEGHSVTMWLKK